MKYRLELPDRERLGAPEWIDCEIPPFTISEAIALKAATGVEAQDAITAIFPTITTKADGSATVHQYSPEGLRLGVWLGLYRLGIAPAYDDLDFDATALLLPRVVATPPAGKAPDSQSGSTRTRRTSASSTRSARSKSKPST